LSGKKKTSTRFRALTAWTVTYSGSPAPIPMMLSRLSALTLSQAFVDFDFGGPWLRDC
jgi:hypothetical protein